MKPCTHGWYGLGECPDCLKEAGDAKCRSRVAGSVCPNCGEQNIAHSVPASMGEPGFYTCKPND